MNERSRRRLYGVAPLIAGLVAIGTVVVVTVAIVHDAAVVRADQYCRGKVWDDLSARRREETRDAIARACTPELISALSSRPARTPEEKACEAVYYPQTTDAENAAMMSACHLTTRVVTENGGVMLLSRRAWRACAAATPGPRVCAGDVLLLAVGMGPALILLGMRRRQA